MGLASNEKSRDTSVYTIYISIPIPASRPCWPTGSMHCTREGTSKGSMNRAFGTLAAIMLLRALIKPFEQFEAYKLGVIDVHGRLLKSPQTAEERRSYDPLTRVAVNLKRLLAKVPGGESQIASLLAAMYLWHEDTEEPHAFLVQPITKNPIKQYLANRSASNRHRKSIDRGIS
jgi:hypothetical protein